MRDRPNRFSQLTYLDIGGTLREHRVALSGKFYDRIEPRTGHDQPLGWHERNYEARSQPAKKISLMIDHEHRTVAEAADIELRHQNWRYLANGSPFLST